MLKEEKEELKVDLEYHKDYLKFQTDKTIEIEKKFSSELANLRAQLKGNHSDQFIKLQQDNKKLLEDNTKLMREINDLKSHLALEKGKVEELYADAFEVRQQLQREI